MNIPNMNICTKASFTFIRITSFRRISRPSLRITAKNPDTGEMANKEVDLLFQKEIEQSWNITFGSEMITTTAGHPFWIKNKGWVEVMDLIAKDLVVDDLFEPSIDAFMAT